MRIKNINDEIIDIEVIRYFNINDNEYLIYSLSEADESGYIKLYASKIVGSKACIITDNDEWDLIKQLIKEIVRNNRDGNELSIVDLDEENLSDVILQDTRVFKLQGNLVTLLSENKNVFKHVAIEEEPQDEIIEENLDYESLYNEQLEKNTELSNQIRDLEEEINNYKEMIEKIKNLIEE